MQVDIGFVARETAAPPKPEFIEVGATYELTYHVLDQSGLTQRDFDAFADMNAVFNAWPYFREFLQSALVRMGLPPFTLPVLRVGTASSSPAGGTAACKPDSDAQQSS